MFSPIINIHSYPLKSQVIRSLFIPSLLRSSSPTTVFRGIRSINVNPVNSMFFRRSWPNVFNKSGWGVNPSIAHGYTPPAISWVRLVSRVSASSFNAVVNVVNLLVISNKTVRSTNFKVIATTTFANPILKRTRPNISSNTAITKTEQVPLSKWSGFGKTENRPASELLTNQVSKFGIIHNLPFPNDLNPFYCNTTLDICKVLCCGESKQAV